MLTTLLILGVSAVLFVPGRIRSDIVALCSLLCLIVFGILSPEPALSRFSNSIVVMMVGLFVVGGAIFRTGLAKMLGGRIMKDVYKRQSLSIAAAPPAEPSRFVSAPDEAELDACRERLQKDERLAYVYKRQIPACSDVFRMSGKS